MDVFRAAAEAERRELAGEVAPSVIGLLRGPLPHNPQQHQHKPAVAERVGQAERECLSSLRPRGLKKEP
jgi:hypothetical protein